MPVPGHPLQTRYYDSYEIESNLSYVNYVVKKPGCVKMHIFLSM